MDDEDTNEECVKWFDADDHLLLKAECAETPCVDNARPEVAAQPGTGCC